MKKEKTHSNKHLVLIFSSLCLVICGLLAGIVFVINNNRLVINTCEEVTDYLSKNSNMNEPRTFIDAVDRVLAAVDDDEVRACAYSERFGVLYNYSTSGNRAYIEQVVLDAHAVDEIRQNAVTAYNVYMAEIMAGNDSSAEEWLRIAEERGIADVPGKG